MQVKTLNFSVSTEGNNHILDVTNNVSALLKETGMKEGNVLVFAPGSTAGITTIEYEPGLLADYPQFFEKLIPSNVSYRHNETWQDGNGYAHIRASLQGASFTVPFEKGRLLLGTWQQIILIDFDNRPRRRTIIAQFIGK